MENIGKYIAGVEEIRKERERCKNCKWWDRGRYVTDTGLEPHPTMGRCASLSLQGSTGIILEQDQEPITYQYFGCIHFEGK